MEDIENLAAQGKKELVVDENTVLMNLARDMARQLGITIVEGSRPAQVKVPPPSVPSAPAKVTPPSGSSTQAKTASPVASAPAARDAALKPDAKPKGCQHAALPVVAIRPEQSKSQPGSDGVVDQLVELVRQSTGKRSGN
jgi:septal ring-binding cell division protein DamX